VFVAAVMNAQEPTPEILRPCEIAQRIEALHGTPIMLVGRFSFRETGRSLSEARCADNSDGSRAIVLEVRYDATNGPKPPSGFSVDEAAVRRKLALVKQTTSLQRFKFGSIEYDRWAMVFGRLERIGDAEGSSKSSQAAPVARIVVRSESYVIFLVD
jgi:hypothetical protein